ncbi:hypothetical protein [Chryseobacterium kwangjuense]|uniref:Uncharacterized protein n=1 Tax=Chryseobacterium kwangjuense TaxID=267125 RepID=A0A135W3U3_9FLAO|nr:hypothetical protein [Chryseobacterium kwangjuense]KXH79588.1 hypothetical protein AU378_19660 [Chryseobacterium kwangjuense]
MNQKLFDKFNQLTTEREFINFISENLECPINCKKGTRLNIIEQELIILWKNVCSKYSVAREEDFIKESYEEQSGLFHIEDFDEFKRVSFNLIQWIDKAKKDFLDITQVFNSKMASAQEYPKHYLKNKMDKDSIIKLAKDKDISYFFPEVTEIHLEPILLDSFTEYFNLILQSENLRFGVKVDKNIGISKTGNETNLMMFEINKSGQIAHAYPCNEDEINKLNIEPQFFDKVYFDWLRGEL